MLLEIELSVGRLRKISPQEQKSYMEKLEKGPVPNLMEDVKTDLTRRPGLSVRLSPCRAAQRDGSIL